MARSSRDEQRKQVRRRALKLLAGMFVSSFVGRVLLWSAFPLAVALVLMLFRVLQPGSAADWMAAAGATFAAGVALAIANGDRSERRDERHVASLAQMRLVKINAREWRDSDSPNVQLKVEITNYGERPILRVLMLDAEVESRSAGTFKRSDPTPPEVPIVPTVMQPQLPHQFFDVAMKNENGEPWEPGRLESRRRKYGNGLRVTIQCLDADGQHWTLSNEDDPYRHVPELGPPAWQRLWDNRREAVAQFGELLAPSRTTRRALLVAAVIAATLLILVVANELYGRA
jgi:hypothetical protein